MDENRTKFLTIGIAGLITFIIGWLWISGNAANAADDTVKKVYLPLVLVDPTPTETPTATPSPQPIDTVTAVRDVCLSPRSF